MNKSQSKTNNILVLTAAVIAILVLSCFITNRNETTEVTTYQSDCSDDDILFNKHYAYDDESNTLDNE